MKIAYLVNQYPKVSHSFIRREIWALEKSGLYVERFSLRSCASELVDPKDKLELNKTKVLLDIGLWGLLFNLMLVAMHKRSEEHTSELQSRETIPYAVFCLKKKHTGRKIPVADA